MIDPPPGKTLYLTAYQYDDIDAESKEQYWKLDTGKKDTSKYNDHIISKLVLAKRKKSDGILFVLIFATKWSRYQYTLSFDAFAYTR